MHFEETEDQNFAVGAPHIRVSRMFDAIFVPGADSICETLVINRLGETDDCFVFIPVPVIHPHHFGFVCPLLCVPEFPRDRGARIPPVFCRASSD